MTNSLKSLTLILTLAFLTLPVACQRARKTVDLERVSGAERHHPIGLPPAQKIVQSCIKQTIVTKFYDPAYEILAYPGGDVAQSKGVCSDVVIRAFRASGVDLQREVHEDMLRHFAAYPKLWGLSRPDQNIDHRRVANLMTFFSRKGKLAPSSRRAQDFLPGDVVAWRLTSGRLHIGVVSDGIAEGTGNREVIHNIGAGARQEDVLFAWPCIGHYRFFAPN